MRQLVPVARPRPPPPWGAGGLDERKTRNQPPSTRKDVCGSTARHKAIRGGIWPAEDVASSTSGRGQAGPCLPSGERVAATLRAGLGGAVVAAGAGDGSAPASPGGTCGLTRTRAKHPAEGHHQEEATRQAPPSQWDAVADEWKMRNQPPSTRRDVCGSTARLVADLGGLESSESAAGDAAETEGTNGEAAPALPVRHVHPALGFSAKASVKGHHQAHAARQPPPPMWGVRGLNERSPKSGPSPVGRNVRGSTRFSKNPEGPQPREDVASTTRLPAAAVRRLWPCATPVAAGPAWGNTQRRHASVNHGASARPAYTSAEGSAAASPPHGAGTAADGSARRASSRLAGFVTAIVPAAQGRTTRDEPGAPPWLAGAKRGPVGPEAAASGGRGLGYRMRDPAPGARGTAVQHAGSDASPARSSTEGGSHVGAGRLWHGRRTSGSAGGYLGTA